MKSKIFWLFGLSAVLIFMGCSEGVNLKSKAIGVEQGNGLTTYNNAKLGVSFKYPSSWKLSESANAESVSIDNSTQVRDSSIISKIEFSISPNLFGETIQDQSQLQRALLKKFPDRDWKPVTFSSGQSGYFWTHDPSAGAGYEGEYFLLDQNYNILWVSYRAFVDLAGVDVVKDIVRSMTVDFTAPVVSKIYFEPTAAHPGETVKLVIETWDDVNQASIYLGDQTPEGWRDSFTYGYSPGYFKSLVGWEGGFFAMGHGLPALIPEAVSDNGPFGISHDRFMGYLLNPDKNPALASAYPFHTAFTKEKNGRFTYTFAIPQGAPPGIISVPRFSVIDSVRNIADFDLATLRRAEEYLSVYKVSSPSKSHISTDQKSLFRPELNIVRDANSRPVNDKPPEISRIWFERTALLPAASQSPDAGRQAMYLEIHSDSPIRETIRYQLVGTSSADSYRWISGPLTAIGNSIYRVDMPFVRNPVLDSRGGTPYYWKGFLGISEVIVADDVGNVFIGRSDNKTLPSAGFLLVPGEQ